MAMEAGEAGADYVAFGAFYPSTTKDKGPDAEVPELETLQWWSSVFEIPCVAIGGITPENIVRGSRLMGTDDKAQVLGVLLNAGASYLGKNNEFNAVGFTNVFGGITACDAVANGVLKALEMLEANGVELTKPIVARIDGNNAVEGRRILNDANHPLIELVETMDDAARRVAQLAAGK